MHIPKTTVKVVNSVCLTQGNIYFVGVFYRYLFFLGPHLQHIEVPKLGVESEL